MHIVMLSDYETQGGAAVAASRLADSLCRSDQVTRCVLYPDGEAHAWKTQVLSRQPVATLWRRFVSRLVPGVSRTAPLPGPMAQLRKALKSLRPDVINVHNLHGGGPVGWAPELVAVCADFAPVVWTLHDMWSFTGRCAYAYDCERFKLGCGASCPTAAEHPVLPAEQIAPAWTLRRAIFERHRELMAVAPSQWLAAQAKSGLWAEHLVETIPYGVPTGALKPMSRTAARRMLGLPPTGPVVLMAAQDVGERRKGAGFFPDAWAHLRHRPVTVLSMGHGSVAAADASVKMVPLGWVADAERQRVIYNAADVLLHPAPVDNFPNVILEALACGTPAVALPVGGVPELVRPGLSGWLAREASAPALARALDSALEDLRQGVNLRDSCRDLAVLEYPLVLQAERYRNLFERLTSRTPCPGTR